MENHMTATTRLALPYLVPGQAQKETTHNEALIRLDLAVKASALSIGLNISPQTPEHGQCWTVGTSPTGIWAGKAGHLAGWTDSGWRYLRRSEEGSGGKGWGSPCRSGGSR